VRPGSDSFIEACGCQREIRTEVPQYVFQIRGVLARGAIVEGEDLQAGKRDDVGKRTAKTPPD